MFCPNCGKQLEDRSKFCINCGTALDAPVAPVNPAPPAAYKAKGNKRNPMKTIVPIAAVALLVVIAIVICIVTGVFGSHKTKLASAIAKSALAYQEASESIPMPAFAEKDKQAAFSQAVNIKIGELPAASSLEGFGVQLALDSNLPQREIALTVTPSFGSTDILDAQVLVKDNAVFLAVPQLLPDRSYVINTETIGASLVNRDLADEELRSFGFNLFDLVELLKENTKIDDETKAELKKAFTQFAKTINVDKTGKENLNVNGHDLKCDAYQVVITEDSLLELLVTLESMGLNRDPAKLVTDSMEAIGAPAYAIDEVLAEIDSAGSTREVFDALEDAIQELGDIELEMFLHKGYVVGARYEVSIDGADLELTVNFGGGDNYADDLRLEILAEAGKIVAESHGNHAGANGVYTDTTTFNFYSDYSDTVTITSKLYYEPNADEENFTWNLDADVLQIDLAGQVVTSKKELSAQLEEVNVWVEGEYIIGMDLDVQVGQYTPASVNTSNAVALLDLSEAEWDSELEYMKQAVIGWMVSLVGNNLDLLAILQGVM